MESKNFLRLPSTDKVELCAQWKEEHKERKRLAIIKKYSLDKWDINDEGLQSISKLASKICNTPFSFISLVQKKDVTFLSRYGTDLKSTARENSFCDRAIEQKDFLEVENSYNDPKFKEHEFVNKQLKPLIYYGGCPINSPDGHPIGTLYVADYIERKMNDTQKKALLLLSEEVMVHLDLKQKYHELKIANEKIITLTNVKQNFMNNVSHDLRTPLNAIKGYADILSKTNLNEDQIEPVKIIKSSCEFLTFLINDILEFSKIQEGKIQLEKIEFNLEETLFDLKDLLTPKAKEKNLTFDLFIDDKIPIFLIGDKMRIYQILMNLTGNAIKFTEKGHIIIKLKSVSETEKNIKIHFSVKDSGIGISEDNLNNIFKRFMQAEKNTARKYGGTGLGLSISKDLVELHESELKVKSTLGKGSKFYFDIVFEKTINSQNNTSVNKKPKLNLKNYKFLICEDNSLNIKLIKSLFKDKNIEIDFAENGQIAINILRKENANKYDLILMDLQMPVLDGFETTKIIRKELNKNIPIIGFSASSSKNEIDHCFEIGMNDYIIKSFGDNLIYEKLLEFLETKNFDNPSKDSSQNSNISIFWKSKQIKEENNREEINYLKKGSMKNNISKIYEKSKNESNEEKENTNEEILIDSYFDGNNEYKLNISDHLTSFMQIENLKKNESFDNLNKSGYSEINVKNLNIFKTYPYPMRKTSNDLIIKNSNNKSDNDKKDKFNKTFRDKKNFSFSAPKFINKIDDNLKEDLKMNFTDLKNTQSFSENKNSLDSSKLNKISQEISSFNKNKNSQEISHGDRFSQEISSSSSSRFSKIKTSLIDYKFSKFNDFLNCNRNFEDLNSEEQNNKEKEKEKEIEKDKENDKENEFVHFLSENEDSSESILNKLSNEVFNINEEIKNKSQDSFNSESLDFSLNKKRFEYFDDETKINFMDSKKTSISNIFIGANLNESKNELNDDELLFSNILINMEDFSGSSQEGSDDSINMTIFEEDPELMQELLGIFVQEYPKQMRNFKDSINTKNLNSIKLIAHSLKTSMLIFGLKKVHSKFEKIEQICKAIDLSEIKILYSGIFFSLKKFMKMISKDELSTSRNNQKKNIRKSLSK